MIAFFYRIKFCSLFHFYSNWWLCKFPWNFEKIQHLTHSFQCVHSFASKYWKVLIQIGIEKATEVVLLKNVFIFLFFKIDRKTPVQGLSFDKVASTWNFIQKETVRSVFFCEFWGIFKNDFFTERIWVTASVESLIRNKLIESSVVTLTHATLILCFYVKKLDLNKLIPELALSQCTNI